MKLEDQVCGLELAKRLKELDVKQESALFYEESVPKKYGYSLHSTKGFNKADAHRYFSAFTVAELGEMLKKAKPIGGTSTEWNEVWNHWQVFLVDQNNEQSWQVNSENESDARAKMLIYLIENKLVTP